MIFILTLTADKSPVYLYWRRRHGGLKYGLLYSGDMNNLIVNGISVPNKRIILTRDRIEKMRSLNYNI